MNGFLKSSVQEEITYFFPPAKCSSKQTHLSQENHFLLTAYSKEGYSRTGRNKNKNKQVLCRWMYKQNNLQVEINLIEIKPTQKEMLIKINTWFVKMFERPK